MSTNSKNKMYFFAAGAAGAVGYLFFTKSGQRVVERVSRVRVDTTAAVADRIEDARLFIEKSGKEMTSKVHAVIDRFEESIDAGKQAYEHGGMKYRADFSRLGQRNAQAIANIHRAVDNMDKTFQTLQETVLDPFCEIGAIVAGVDHGVRHFFEKQLPPVHYLDQRITG